MFVRKSGPISYDTPHFYLANTQQNKPTDEAILQVCILVHCVALVDICYSVVITSHSKHHFGKCGFVFLLIKAQEMFKYEKQTLFPPSP